MGRLDCAASGAHNAARIIVHTTALPRIRMPPPYQQSKPHTDNCRTREIQEDSTTRSVGFEPKRECPKSFRNGFRAPHKEKAPPRSRDSSTFHWQLPRR